MLDIPEGHVIDDKYEVQKKLGSGDAGTVYRVVIGRRRRPCRRIHRRFLLASRSAGRRVSLYMAFTPFI